MNYREIKPGEFLEKHVKCYYFYESDSSDTFDDTVFPSGCIELIFNLGAGSWQTERDGLLITNPSVELWGQITRPLPVRSIGKNTMMGIRFFPHAAAHFLPETVLNFNNMVVDYRDVVGYEIDELHCQLIDLHSNDQKVLRIEKFLCHKLASSGKRYTRISMVSDIMTEIGHPDFFDNIDNVASRYGITSRHLQKLFLQYTGLTPKLYSKINRFQNSLRRVNLRDTSLTEIAYDCGYFDQSHFIRDFKSFTGYTPSLYAAGNFPITIAGL